MSAELDTKTIVENMQRLFRYPQRQEAERNSILMKLSSLEFHEKQREVYAKCHRSTGQWLLNSHKYQQWFNGERNSVLWCSGILGAGKTVMTSIVVDHVYEATQGANVAIAYIYCDDKDPRTQSEFSLLFSIIRQLVEQTSPIPTVVKEFCEKNAQEKRDSADNLISLFKAICLLFKRTYIFVDALDECLKKNTDNFLCMLQKIEPLVRLFFTSRSHFAIQTEFANMSQTEISASDSDIKIYLKSEIEKNNRLSIFATKDSKLSDDIIEMVTKQAAGMFLLAHLQIENLGNQVSLKNVRKAMSSLPAGLQAAYAEAIKRIDDQPEECSNLARRAISLLFCVRRPLNMEEMSHTLHIKAEDTELGENLFPRIEILLSICAGLVKINKNSGAIGLVHHTLEEYLEKNRQKVLPDPEM